MSIKQQSYIYVFIQLSLIAYVCISEIPFCSTPYLLAIEIWGILMVLFAVWSMKMGNFNINSVPKEKGELRTTGFYAVVRHPMYLSTLVVLLPLVIDYFNYYRLAAYVLLILVLIFKLTFEEKLLLKEFEGYRDYRKKTWRLVPFVY